MYCFKIAKLQCSRWQTAVLSGSTVRTPAPLAASTTNRQGTKKNASRLACRTWSARRSHTTRIADLTRGAGTTGQLKLTNTDKRAVSSCSCFCSDVPVSRSAQPVCLDSPGSGWNRNIKSRLTLATLTKHHIGSSSVPSSYVGLCLWPWHNVFLLAFSQQYNATGEKALTVSSEKSKYQWFAFFHAALNHNNTIMQVFSLILKTIIFYRARLSRVDYFLEFEE